MTQRGGMVHDHLDDIERAVRRNVWAAAALVVLAVLIARPRHSSYRPVT